MEAKEFFYHISRKNGFGYIIGIVALIFVWIGVMGPGVWPFSNNAISSSVYQNFSMLCHQLPNRSVIINGHITMVCARCLGFYSALPISWLILGIAYWHKGVVIKTGLNRSGLVLFLLIVVNIVNIAGQALGLWSTITVIRFLLGTVLGATLIAYIFLSLLRQNFIINLNSSTYGHNG